MSMALPGADHILAYIDLHLAVWVCLGAYTFDICQHLVQWYESDGRGLLLQPATPFGLASLAGCGQNNSGKVLCLTRWSGSRPGFCLGGCVLSSSDVWPGWNRLTGPWPI